MKALVVVVAALVCTGCGTDREVASGIIRPVDGEGVPTADAELDAVIQAANERHLLTPEPAVSATLADARAQIAQRDFRAAAQTLDRLREVREAGKPLPVAAPPIDDQVPVAPRATPTPTVLERPPEGVSHD